MYRGSSLTNILVSLPICSPTVARTLFLECTKKIVTNWNEKQEENHENKVSREEIALKMPQHRLE